MKFLMNSYWSDYKNQCFVYLMHVEGSAGDGSIRCLLIEAGYIEDNAAITITSHTVKDQISYYNFTVDLTQKGLENW
jgi:secreted Zn-dependent insulinase-like peptidase